MNINYGNLSTSHAPVYSIMQQQIQHLTQQSKVVPYSIMSVGHGADPGFLAVSLQVT